MFLLLISQLLLVQRKSSDPSSLVKPYPPPRHYHHQCLSQSLSDWRKEMKRHKKDSKHQSILAKIFQLTDLISPGFLSMWLHSVKRHKTKQNPKKHILKNLLKMLKTRPNVEIVNFQPYYKVIFTQQSDTLSSNINLKRSM